ncbi:S1 RNA-binding domain-containing protein [Streptomyces sp. NPDC051940]|uniref:S1 RNA-binding domain-containing protein n=1 Tax=Streptomyces sp. NPDC051940 TaxID=3155675 RepID=UPI0034171A6C
MILRIAPGRPDSVVAAVAGLAGRAGVRELIVDNPMVDGFFRHTGVPWRGRLPAELPDGLAGFHDGMRVPVATGLALLRVMLERRGPWCRLRTEDGFFVHVDDRCGVYVGTAGPGDEALGAEHVDGSPYDPALDTVDELRPADEAFWAEVTELVAAATLLLEEQYVHKGFRWHVLAAPGDVEAVRAGLAPRARLALWPGPTDDWEELRAAIARHPGPQLFVWPRRRDGAGWEGIRLAEEWMLDDHGGGAMVPGPAAVVPMLPGDRHPLLRAVLPDPDGVPRARWRTNPTPADDRRAYLCTLRPGDVVTGVVATGLDDIGVHVDLDHPLGAGLGFLRVPEMSWEHWESLDDVAPVGRRIRARILSVDFEFERLELSVKALQPDPWAPFCAAHLPGDVVTGTVTRLTPVGAFVRVAHGVEGILRGEGGDPVDESADAGGHPVAHAGGEALVVGDRIAVTLTEVDRGRRRIALAPAPPPT